MKQNYQAPGRKGIKRHSHIFIPVIFVCLLLAGAFVYRYVLVGEDTSVSEQSEIVTPEEPEEQTTETEIAPLPSVQAELDEWLAGASGTHSVQLIDPETQAVLAEHNADEVFFAASIYKLYVAYLGLMDIDDNEVDPEELYNQGRTRKQCIIEMVRDSDSPCAEQMWAEQGKESSTERLTDLFGFSGTSMTAVTTTARDATTLLVRLQQQQDLSAESDRLLRTALREQIYREAIPTGAPETTVYNKVGFYETGWLDTAIVELPDDREVILTIFSDGAGSRQIASMTEALITPLLDI